LTLPCCKNASSLVIEQGVPRFVYDLPYVMSVLELANHPHVLEVTVVARSHLKWGERPMAFVILHPQHAAQWSGRHHEFAEELKRHAKSKLPGFACPEWVEVVPELPVSFLHLVAIAGTKRGMTHVENFNRQDTKDGIAKDSCKALKRVVPSIG